MTMRRVLVPGLGLSALVVSGFLVGNHLARERATLQLQEQAAQLDALRSQVAIVLEARNAGRVTGTAGFTARNGAPTPDPAVVEAVKEQLRHEMGLISVRMLRERRGSFAELYATDAEGNSTYGTAGHLGHGYFITVKHGVIPLGAGSAGRALDTIKLKVGMRLVRAVVFDSGNARSEVDPGDWAILRATEPVDLPALRVNLGYGFAFADPIVRLGNDYSKGIIAATGYVGESANGLVTCLTDGHPGVSGGGVLDQDGALVGIPVGRMQGDFRFSFILPLRQEMFRKVPPLAADLASASH